MKLNVGCGGDKYAFLDLKCEVNCDVQRPKVKIPNFVISDIRNLPFRDKVFERAYAFNVLEHVGERDKALRELNRTSNQVTIRFDKIYNLANWFTVDHEAFAVENTLRAFPMPIEWVIRLVRFPIDRSKTFRTVVHKTFPALRNLGLLDNWNYYQLE